MRIKKQIRQEEMADLVGMTQPTYSRKERGVVNITTQEWELMAKILEVEIQDIYQDITRKNVLPRKSNSPYLSIPDFILEELDFLKKENLKLKEKIKILTEKSNNSQ